MGALSSNKITGIVLLLEEISREEYGIETL